jgi:hypothetical protein
MVTSRRGYFDRWFAVGDSGDLDAFDDLLHEYVVLHAPLGFATNGRKRRKRSGGVLSKEYPPSYTRSRRRYRIVSTVVAGVVATGTRRGEFAGVPARGNRFEIDQVTFGSLGHSLASQAAGRPERGIGRRPTRSLGGARAVPWRSAAAGPLGNLRGDRPGLDRGGKAMGCSGYRPEEPGSHAAGSTSCSADVDSLRSQLRVPS